jgi:uncharacterized protein (DUF779 family)
MSSCHGVTPRAHRLLERVRADVDAASDPLAFMISGGCCGGTNPVLLRRSNIIDGFDVHLGEIDGIPVYAHPEHARYLQGDCLVIDALEGERSDTFSLEIAYGGRFVLKTEAES